MLSESISLIEYISNRALFCGEPFADILCDKLSDDKIFHKNLSSGFSEAISQGVSVPEAWEKTVTDVLGKELEMYECDVLIHFGKDICNSHSDDIKRLNDAAANSLREFYKTAVENKNKKSKSTAAIAVSLGAMIVLMFA